MRTRLIHINERNENYVGFQQYNKDRNTNAASINRMKRILAKAIESELTPLQKHCFTEHFLNGKKQKEIAEQLGLNCSTVSRHIAAGKKKLKTIANYYTE